MGEASTSDAQHISSFPTETAGQLNREKLSSLLQSVKTQMSKQKSNVVSQYYTAGYAESQVEEFATGNNSSHADNSNLHAESGQNVSNYQYADDQNLYLDHTSSTAAPKKPAAHHDNPPSTFDDLGALPKKADEYLSTSKFSKPPTKQAAYLDEHYPTSGHHEAEYTDEQPAHPDDRFSTNEVHRVKPAYYDDQYSASGYYGDSFRRPSTVVRY